MDKILWFFALITSCICDHKVERYCDIVIGGGNSGALSAAITAAQSARANNQNISICLLEPTDWYGGQMAPQGVSEMDESPACSKPQNQPKLYKELIKVIGNPGRCASIPICYQPLDLLNEYVFPTLSNLSEYITVYNRTVIVNTFNKTDVNGNKYISAVTAIQRKPIDPSKEWTYLFSQQVQDWYSPNNSSMFTKTEYTFSGKIFVEGSEFSDITMTSGIKIFQGVEAPYENSTATHDLCGQSTVFPFFVKLLATIPSNPPIIPPGQIILPFPATINWESLWLSRRSYDAMPNASSKQINFGDISQQTGLHSDDYWSGYMFLSVADAQKAAQWKGGLNITSLTNAEQRSFAWYHYYINKSNESSYNIHFDSKQLVMELNTSGTKTGLAKFPYIRDNRRSYGLFGFRMNHSTAMDLWNQTSAKGNYPVGYKFHDTVAIGDWKAFDIHPLKECEDNTATGYPKYITIQQSNGPIVPYYIPFRSLGQNVFVNLLFTGKNIATSFFMASATRLHPVEWNIGVAAGAAAQYMMMNGINDTRVVYSEIDKFQQYLQSSVIEQPIDWS